MATQMANQEHLDILAKGVEAWNAWRDESPTTRPLLSRADLRNADLRGVDLSNSSLRSADLTRAELSQSNLNAADLTGAKLIGANLSLANLVVTNFSNAVLGNADFNGARIWCTVFADVDLSGVRHLELVDHRGPSTVGTDTIYRSQGKIPESFLRGCGVPETLITYMSSLVGVALDFYSCFISYSTKDQDFADRLYADLQAKGVRCWFAPHDIQGGKKVHEQIDEAIRIYDKLLLAL